MIQRFLANIGFATIFISIGAKADISFSKAQNYLKRNKGCYFSTGFSNPYGPKSQTPDVAEEVFCVADGIIGEGTINEKSGCAFMLLNMNSGKLRKGTYSPMMNPEAVELAIVEEVKCSQGGFEKLLETNFKTIYGKGPKVKNILFTGPEGIGAIVNVLYSESEVARKVYDQAIAKIAAEEKIAENKLLEQQKISKAKAEVEKQKILASILGAWSDTCSGKDGFGDKTIYNFEKDNTFSVYIDQYKSEKCETNKKYQRITIEGSYVEGADPKIKAPAKFLDFVVKSVRFVIYDRKFATEQSEQSKFGLVSIVANKDYDISSSEEFKSAINKKSYGLYLLNEGKLYFNKSTGGIINSDSNRANLSIDTSVIYQRDANE